MQQKQFEQGSLQQYNPISGNKKNIRQPNITPKTTGKIRTKPPKLAEGKKS